MQADAERGSNPLRERQRHAVAEGAHQRRDDRVASMPSPKLSRAVRTDILAILLVSCSLTACAVAPESFDVVLKSGRVIDPETDLDGVRDVGIRGDTIA